MTSTVIIYSSFAGKTRRIAQYLAKAIDADLFDLKLQTHIDLSSYSRVILGSGVHAGNPYGRLVKFVEANRSVLNDKDVYLFVSCLYKGERADKQIEQISHDLKIRNFTYFSSRSEKNEAGISVDVDIFAERMGS